MSAKDPGMHGMHVVDAGMDEKKPGLQGNGCVIPLEGENVPGHAAWH
jgi:hypothetical protein